MCVYVCMFMRRKFCRLFLSFYLYMDSENETLITIIEWQIFFTHSLSHVDSPWVATAITRQPPNA